MWINKDAYDPDPSARLSAVLAQGTLDKDKADILATWGTVRLDKEFSDALRKAVEDAEDIPKLIELLGKDKAVALLAELIEADHYEEPWVSREILENETTAGIQKMMDTMREHTKRMAETFISRALQDIQENKPAVPEVPYLPNPYDRKETETADKANNKVTHGIGLAIVSGGKNTEKKVNSWRDNTVNKHPLFPCNQGRDKMTVYLDPEGYNAAELWAKVHNLDALTLDVYMACLAFICDPRNKATYPHVGWFTVNPQQIADMKAFRRYGNDRRVLIGKIIEAIHTIADFRTDFRIHWPGKGKKEQNRMATETGCRLFHIGSVIYLDQGELFEHPEQFPKEEKNIVGVSLFIGKWGNYWLQDGETYYWVAAVTRLLLELGSSKGDEFAKKIGGLLLTVEGGTRSRNKTLDFTVAELLEHIGELLAEEYRGKLVDGKQDGQNWANRTADYLQAGLTTLLQIGVLASYNFSSDYPEPDDRGRGWSERWLSAKVYLTTPEAATKLKMNLPPVIPGVPERKRRVRGLGKTKKPLQRGQYLDAATIAAVYNAYKARNWTQATLAKELKIARPTLSNVLTGKESPSVDLAKRIRAFLEIPVPENY